MASEKEEERKKEAGTSIGANLNVSAQVSNISPIRPEVISKDLES